MTNEQAEYYKWQEIKVISTVVFAWAIAFATWMI